MFGRAPIAKNHMWDGIKKFICSVFWRLETQDPGTHRFGLL